MSQHAITPDHHGGWNPQRPDHRDRQYGLEESILLETALPPTGGIALDQTPPIWDQGQLGSCTAHGSLRALLIEAIKQGLSVPMLSRLMQYYDSRSLEGTVSSDSGATVRDAVKSLAQFGCAPETDWAYDISKFAEKPPDQAYTDAKQHMAIKYQSIRVGPGAPIRTALSRGLAVVFGFSVPASFEDGSWDPASGQPLPLPGPNEGFIGGHCVILRAWNFSGTFVSGPAGSSSVPDYFTCQNSWGGLWGMGGEFNIASAWFTPWRQLATDLWVIQQAD